MTTEISRYALATRLVEREVIYCVSALISTLAGREWDGSDGIDQDDLYALARRAPTVDDYREAAENDRHSTVKVTDQYWSATGADGEPGEGRADSELEAWREAIEFIGIDTPDGSEVYEHWIVSSRAALALVEASASNPDDVDDDSFELPSRADLAADRDRERYYDGLRGRGEQ